MVSATEVFKDIIAGRVFILDNQGNFYVNSGSHSISKYSPCGKLILKMGQKGEGPGDIKRLGWFSINPLNNTIYVTEFFTGNKWLSKFSMDGKYLGDWKCDLDWINYDALSVIKFDIKGNVFLEAIKSSPRRYKDFTIGAFETVIIKFSPKGEKLKEVYTFTSDFYAEKGGRGNITIPFHSFLNWNIYNDKIIIRESHADFINVFSPDGKLEKRIPLPFKRLKIKEKDLDEWDSYLKSVQWIKKGIAEGWFDLKYWRKRLPFPKFKPVSVGQLFIDSQGNLYSKKHSGYQLKENTWAKINLSNYKISIVKFNPDETLLYIWKNYFFFHKLDGKDNDILTKIDEKMLFQGVR